MASQVAPRSTRSTRSSNNDRGRRTGVEVSGSDTRKDESGMEHLDSYFAGARSAEKGEEKKVDVFQNDSTADKEGDEASGGSSTAKKKKEKEKKNAKKLRFSLPEAVAGPGQASGAGAAARKLVTRHGRGSISPGDLSSVATADSIPEDTPSPAAPIPNGDVDDQEEEQQQQEQVVVHQKNRQSTPITPKANADEPVFDDDNDDMVPPPPPPADDDKDENPLDAAAADDDDDDFPITHQDDDDDDDDDDNKDGDGYLLTQEEDGDDAETPISAKKREKGKKSSKKALRGSDDDSDDSLEAAERSKKKKKKNKKSVRNEKKRRKAELESESSDDEKVTPPPKKQTKKRKKAPYKMAHFTPKGIPAGPREFTAVPISDCKEAPAAEEQGLRRSKRARIKPLEFWKNEAYVYGPDEDFADEDKFDSLVNMPVPKAINRAEPTPYKPRKVSNNNKKKPSKEGKRRKGNDDDYEDSSPFGLSVKPFDTRKLPKKYKYENREDIYLWDDCIHQACDMKVVSHSSNLIPRDLPRAKSRPKSESRVVGKAAQAFNVFNEENPQYPGYLMGNLVLPPRGIKDAESVGSCAQTFTVVSCQDRSLEIAYGHPDDNNGEVLPETASRVLLNRGDMFRIPPGNCYRLENHSRDVESYLTWTIIRPFPEED